MIEHFLIEETRSEKWKIPYNDNCDKRSNSLDYLKLAFQSDSNLNLKNCINCLIRVRIDD